MIYIKKNCYDSKYKSALPLLVKKLPDYINSANLTIRFITAEYYNDVHSSGIFHFNKKIFKRHYRKLRAKEASKYYDIILTLNMENK
jgi:hypothetical protein